MRPFNKCSVRKVRKFSYFVYRGISDIGYISVFKQLVDATLESYKPSSIVMLCGADSIRRDRLAFENGAFNLSSKGHVECVQYVARNTNSIPLLLLGGGGYVLSPVADVWAQETAIAAGFHWRDIDGFFEETRVSSEQEQTSSSIDSNSFEKLEAIKCDVINALKSLHNRRENRIRIF
jgi:acetoin utilization deacetylase AcuC-like enzyme